MATGLVGPGLVTHGHRFDRARPCKGLITGRARSQLSCMFWLFNVIYCSRLWGGPTLKNAAFCHRINLYYMQAISYVCVCI